MRSTKLTVRKRVEEVLRLRLSGALFHDLRQYAAEQGWGVSTRQLWRYIALSDARLAQAVEKDRTKLLNRHVAQRGAIFARAISANDYRAALAAAADEARLLGLYAPVQTEVTGKDGDAIKIQQQRQEMHEEMARLKGLSADELQRIEAEELERLRLRSEDAEGRP